MMAKIVKGQDFGGVVNYILNPQKGAEILDSDGIMLEEKQTITDSFKLQTELNPGISKPVGHISLNFSSRDMEKLSSQLMVQVAADYMNQMGITNTQYLIARHYDKEHPHIHLVFNRIDYNGETISDRNDRIRSAKICKELTRKYSLYFAPGKEKVKESRLKEPDKTRYEIYHKLKEIVPRCQNWNQLAETLNNQGIKVSFKCKGKSNEIQGVIFEMNGYSFSGSKVDRQFSFSRISYQLLQSQQKTLQNTTQPGQTLPSQSKLILTGVLNQWQKQTDYRKQKEKKTAAQLKRQKKNRGYRM